MDVDLIFKIAAIGIIVAVLNQVLIRAGREEQAMMTTLAGIVVVLMMLIKEINTLFETVKFTISVQDIAAFNIENVNRSGKPAAARMKDPPKSLFPQTRM